MGSTCRRACIKFWWTTHLNAYRIDYVLFTPPDAFHVEDIHLVGLIPDADGNYLSDHLGIIAVLVIDSSVIGHRQQRPRSGRIFSHHHYMLLLPNKAKS